MLDLVEEIKFAELREKCRELKVMAPPEIMISLKVTEKDKTIFDDIQRGHSWTRNFYNAIMFHMFQFGNTQTQFGAGYASSKFTNGAVNGSGYYLTGGSLCGIIPAAANLDTIGIVLGTGTTAFSTEQFALAAKIAQGVGAGQFTYLAQSVATAAYNSGTKVWTVTHSRVFNNNSGGLIVVREVALFSAMGSSIAGPMYERSVLSPEVSVPDGAQLTVVYNISMSFAAID